MLRSMNDTTNRPVADVKTGTTCKDARWDAVVARDASADGQFFYSVRTTGVYCKPSCPSRRARPENVRFHGTAADAERAGFRACSRCEPQLPPLATRHAATIAEACRVIETADESPSLETLARAAGMSAYHFHRIFRAIAGVTPRAYASAHRMARLRERLSRERGTVTEAIYDAGFRSSTAFYANVHDALGMTPTAYRAGGSATTIVFAVGTCSLGAFLVARSARGVCAIELGEDPAGLASALADRFPQAELVANDAAFDDLVATIVGLIEHPGNAVDLPLDVRGTAFQHRVWTALRAIPAGTTATYAEIARTIGVPKAIRAVASACAANGLAVAIPCHRVVRGDGTLGGYRWGIERKRALLEREATA